MKRTLITRLITFLWLIAIGGTNHAWAADDTTTKVNAPTITPGDCTYNGTIMPIIEADKGCSIVYVKSTSKIYTTIDAIDNNKGVKTENSNKASITDIVNKTGNRYISAYAFKDVNGTRYKSAVTTATYTYDKNAVTKTDLTLVGNSIALDMAKPTETATINITATAGTTPITGLTYRYEVYPEGIVTVDENGVVTPKKAGTASITVIFDGNEKYNAATCVVDVNVASKSTSTDHVFYSIADMRHATQPADDYVWNNNTRNDVIKNQNCALIFTKENPATVIAITQNADENIKEKIKNTFFIIDNSNRGLWITQNDVINPTKSNLKVGTKITGTFLGTYAEREKGIPSLIDIKDTKKTIDNTTYEMSFNFDNPEEGLAVYPYTEITDVNTIAQKGHTYGDISRTSYGVYLNSIIQIPGTIKKNGSEYYLVQNEDTETSDLSHRIYFSGAQINVNLDDYVGTSGTFEGILIKRNDSESKLIVLKNDFFSINKIYLDENDDEKRIDDLVNAGAFDDEVDVYIHRTKLTNEKAWNTVCFPFDLTAEEFNYAFGCEITELAKPKETSDTEVNGRLTKIGEVDNDGNLLFEKQSELNIKEGIPYLIKASGTQTACTKTNIIYTDKTPQDLMKEDKKYYAHIGQKFITVVPPHQIQGTYNNNVVNGDFYFRGLYGRKTYTEDADGNLTEALIADNGSQKYQYISTAEGNYLKYLPANSELKFPGFRAYFYFPNWDKTKNNPTQPNSMTNSKIHLLVDNGSTTGISTIEKEDTNDDNAIYNLAGQKVDSSYKGIVIKNGRKYWAK